MSLLETLMEKLASCGIDKQLIVEQSIITPSCGTGSLTPEEAELVYDRLSALSSFMKEKYK